MKEGMKMKDETIKKLKKKIVSSYIKDKIQGSREDSEEEQEQESTTVRTRHISSTRSANEFQYAN
jgi:hypothetical protein